MKKREGFYITSNDFLEITQRRYEYAMGIDTRDFGLLRSVFTENIVMNFEDYNGLPAAKVKADDWVESCKPLFLGLDSTQHLMSNPIVTVQGDTASCKMQMQALHFYKKRRQEEFSIGGYYEDKLFYNGSKWLISAVTLNIFWTRGIRDIMVAATKKGQTILDNQS